MERGLTPINQPDVHGGLPSRYGTVWHSRLTLNPCGITLLISTSELGANPPVPPGQMDFARGGPLEQTRKGVDVGAQTE